MKRGQAGIMTGFFLLAVFIVVWALVLGPMFNTNGNLAVQGGNLSGVEAWLVSGAGWNLIILICVIIAVLGLAYGFGSGGGG